MNSQPTHGADPGRARPVQEIRLGAVRAAIWRNDTESGIRHNVTFERIYKDGDDWRSTSSFGRDDLLLLGKVADQAHSWIHNQGRDVGPAQGGSPTSSPSSSAEVPAQGNPATRTRRRSDGILNRGNLPSAPSGT